MYKDYIKIDTDVTGSKAINQSIKNILLTPKDSVPGKPDFGSEIHKIIFNPIDHITKSILSNFIRESLNKYEPRIIIQDTEIKEIPEYNRIVISIVYNYSINGLTNTERTNISIDK